MSDFDSLREDIAAFAEQGRLARELATGHLLEQSRQIDKLWADNAELRDEINAVANRVEALTRGLTAAPAEVAAAIVTEANRYMLREVRGDES